MHKIIILGGGFGGVRCALDLDKKLGKDAQITLIDRNSYHLFVPDIYEIASAFGLQKDPFSVNLRKTVCMPYADIFQNTGINFIEGELTEINLTEKIVKTQGEMALNYDYLVIAVGSEVADYNVPGVMDYAHQFKTLDDALFINQSLMDLSDKFSKKERLEPFSFIICGGGFTGIELAAELGCCSRAIKNACSIDGKCSNISIFEAGPKILPMVSEKERNLIKKRLTKLGIVLNENSPIEEVGPDFIKLKSGQKINGDLIIWTAGTKPNRILKNINGLALSQNGRIKINLEMKMDGSEAIYAIGESAELIDPKTQKPVPSFAYVSSDQGKIAAVNIVSALKNRKAKNYKPFYNIWVIPIGGKYALARLWGGINILGFWAWVIREIIDLRYLLSIFTLKEAFKVFYEEIKLFTKND